MPTVMIIDNSRMIRSYYRLILEGLGVKTIEALNGMEGLEKTLDQPVDLYIVDVNMPVMDGYSFIRELHHVEVDKKSPIIMTSIQKIDKTEAFKSGANFFEIKPMSPHLLQDYMNTLFKIEA